MSLVSCSSILHGSVIGVVFVADAAPQCNRDDSVAMYPCLRMGLCKLADFSLAAWLVDMKATAFEQRDMEQH